jgi:hypothetical protein
MTLYLAAATYRRIPDAIMVDLGIFIILPLILLFALIFGPLAAAIPIIIGTTSWGASGVWYQDAPLGTVRFDADFASPDVTIALSAQGGNRRIGERVAIETSMSAPKRTPTRGA